MRPTLSLRRQTRSILSLAIAAALVSLATPAQVYAQDQGIEEVVVTGSFIRRTEGFKSSSPLTQVSADDIANFGTPNIGDVISSLTFNNGTPTSANILNSTAATAETQSINLRGLGGGATLTLMDGLRVNGSNVNVFLPQIAIQRLDIVTDGAAALYGTSAVAGVANFVPIKSYDGAKVEAFYLGDDRGDYEDGQVSFIGGTNWNGFDIVVAAQMQKNSNLGFLDRPEQYSTGLSASTTGNPGVYNVPLRDENGQLTGGNTARPDPNCGTREDQTSFRSNVNGWNLGSRLCMLEIGEWHDYQSRQEAATGYTNISYEVNEDLSFAFQGSVFQRESFTRRSPSSSSVNLGPLPVLRGELPGNTFRAVNGNGDALFALDGDGNGIPDRGPNNEVILDPSGIPFSEDVTFSRWRPFTKHGTLPSGLQSDGTRRDGNDVDGYRAVLSTEFNVPVLEGWTGSSSYTRQKRQSEGVELNYRTSVIAEALGCDVLGNAAACFNPFLSVDGSTLNSQSLVDEITTVQRSKSISELQTLDAVITGEITPGGFELPGGTIAAAVGFQWRQNSSEFTPTPLAASGDAFINSSGFSVDYKRNTRAFFLELSLPVLENLELQVAARREEYSGGLSSTDPKYGFVYLPTENLTIRGSAGTSFIVPTLADLGSPRNCGLTGVDDPFSSFSAFADTCISGNPNLKAETADTLSFGFSWDITNDLTLSLDWTETEFSDRIVAFDAQDVLAVDFANYVSANGMPGTANGKPTLDQLAAWVSNPLSDKRIKRGADDLSFIVEVESGQTNASSELVRAADLNVTYRLPWESVGSFNLIAAATYIDTHKLQLLPTAPEFEATGNQNDFTSTVPPIPRWKANATVAWLLGNHSARVTTRFVDEVNFDGPAYSFQRSFNSYYRGAPDVIRANTRVDASYTYRNIELFNGLGQATIGARNLFDRSATKLPSLGGNDPYIEDPMGRMLYMRFTYEL